MRNKGGNFALGAIVGPVVGVRHSVRSRVIVVGVAVAVVIAVALIPTTVGIFCSCTCCASSVGIDTNCFYDMAVLLQQFIDLRLLLVYLCLLFSDDLQQVVILRCHLWYVLFVGRCRYRHFAEIVY